MEKKSSMKPEDPKNLSTIEFIKYWIRVLNASVLLVTSVILFLVIKFVYDTLDYVPVYSVVTMLVVVVILSVAGLLTSKITSRKAILAIEEYSEKLQKLLTTSRQVHEIGYSDVLLKKIMDVAIDMTGADAGSLLLTQGSDSLTFRIVTGQGTAELEGSTIPRSQGIVGWAVDKGSPVRIEDASRDSRFYPEADKLVGSETKSILCVPLRLDSAPLGALELVSRKQGAFSEEDEGLLKYFADQAALSLEKTRFVEDGRNFEIHLTNILIEAIENISGKRGHAKRVARYSLMVAEAISMPEEERKRLFKASLLHDIGFIRMSVSEAKTPSDYHAHAEVGADLLRPINFYADIVPVVLHHHERYDGKGYPAGLKGTDIPLDSRIIAIAEAFDAMVSTESYKSVEKVISPHIHPSVVDFDLAIEEIRNNAGAQFDPDLAQAFVQAISEDDLS
jgi:putative nucleotidyltransferase with HDIG domain